MTKKKLKMALIADDHILYRCGLALLLKDELGFTEVLEASSLGEGLDGLARSPALDLALFDLRMPGMQGCASLASVRAQHPDMKLAIISASEEKADVLAALDGGLNGFMPKSMSNAQTVGAMRDILDGRIYVPGLVTKVTPRPASPAPAPPPAPIAQIAQLTARQRDVFDLACQGLMNREIAKKLQISEGTVKVHISTMLAIFNFRSRSEFLLLR